MSLTRTSPTTPTTPPDSIITNPAAVTTPYVYPSSCTSLLSLCSGGLNFLCVNTFGNSWSRCQPGSTNIAVYTPAVCPSGWWAFDVGMRETGGVTAEPKKGGRSAEITGRSTISTARCCRGGDFLGLDHLNLYHAHVPVGAQAPSEFNSICIETWNGGTSTRFVESKMGQNNNNEDLVTSIAMPSGRAYYPAWSVEWVEADLSKLSPQWPMLSNNMLIPTWTEGMYISPILYEDKGDLKPSFVPIEPEINEVKERGGSRRRKTLKIYLPVGIVLFILLVIAYWYVFRIIRRRKKAEERRRVGTWSPDQLQLEENARRGQDAGGTLDAAGKKLGGSRWWRRKKKPETMEAQVAELQELGIPIR